VKRGEERRERKSGELSEEDSSYFKLHNCFIHTLALLPIRHHHALGAGPAPRAAPAAWPLAEARSDLE